MNIRDLEAVIVRSIRETTVEFFFQYVNDWCKS